MARSQPLLRSRKFRRLDQKQDGWAVQVFTASVKGSGFEESTMSNDLDLSRPCGDALMWYACSLTPRETGIFAFLRITSLEGKFRAQKEVAHSSRPQNNSMRQLDHSIVLTDSVTPNRKIVRVGKWKRGMWVAGWPEPAMCDVRLFSKFGTYASLNRDGRFPAARRGELQVMQQRRGTMRGAFLKWTRRRIVDREATTTR
jgi:hypothetical protein